MGSYKPYDGGAFGYSSQAAVVAVDTGTGRIEILDYAAVFDCGTQINPMVVEGQIHGGIAGGIGNALYEHSTYAEDGQPTAVTFGDYHLPNAICLPDVKIESFETPSANTVHGMKGVGENAINGPPAVIMSAVNDALRGIGAMVNETPMRPLVVLRAILHAEEQSHETRPV